ncbi:MAG: hypothetical protein ABIP48_33190, partial [Planctomycetota bacterium]
ADNIDALNPGYEGLLGSGRVNSDTAVNGTLPPPRIEGLTRVGRTRLFVELANVFQKGTIEAENFQTGQLLNWELREDGADGEFDTPDDTIVPLTLVTDYMIGTNSLEFTYNSLPEGNYRFTGVGGPPFSGLSDPFWTLLDGNGDGTGGDDYVFEFEAVALNVTTTPDGSPDTFLVTRNGDQVEVRVNAVLAGSVSVNGAPVITLTGSTDTDRFDVDSLNWDFGGDVVVNAQAAGVDEALLDDSPGLDRFKAWATVATFQMEDAYKITASNVRWLHAYAENGGADIAELYGEAGAVDRFKSNETANQATLQSTNDYARAKSFRYVYAYANAGDADVAQLYGKAGAADNFISKETSSPDWATLYSTNDYSRAKSFAQVQAYANAGDNDVATLYDSAADDFFEGDDQLGWLYGGGFDTKAWYFAVGQAIAEDRDDYDTQTISGTPLWTALGDWEN